MSNKTLKLVHLIYGIVLSLVMAVIAALCIAMCYDIYKTGPSPFTREAVYEKFTSIAALVYAFIALVIGGAILNLALPLEKKKAKGSVSDRTVLCNMSKRLKNVSCEGASKIERQRIVRFVMIIICIILVVGASIAATVNVINGFDITSHDITAQVLKGCFTILSYFSAPLIYLIVTAYVCKHSIKKELEIVKNEFKSQRDAAENTQKDCQFSTTFTKLTTDLSEMAEKASTPKKWHKYASLGVKCAVGALAITFIILGIVNGDVSAVFTKAINICTECVGMG